MPALIGPPVLAWVHPDETLSVLGLSFLLFLAGFEVDIRRFRGRTGRHVALALAGSIALATAVGAAFSAVGVRGGLLVAIALLATSVGLIVPVLADASVLHRPVGVLTVACASAGEVAAVVALSVGVAGSHTPLASGTHLLASATPLRRSHTLPPSEMKSLYGSIHHQASEVLVKGHGVIFPLRRGPKKQPSGAFHTRCRGRSRR